jgi:hypothetical protein
VSLSEIELHEGPWTDADYLALPDDGWRLVQPFAVGLDLPALMAAERPFD